MKNIMVKVIKSNKYSFSLAKKVYQRFSKNYQVIEFEKTNNFAYYLTEQKELTKLKESFSNIDVSNKKMWVFLTDIFPDGKIHSLFEENPDISFISLAYFKKYNKKIKTENLIFLNDNNKELNNKLLEIID